MTIIKRCEKDVAGSWADKQLQAAAWLDHFVPHYSGRCVSAVVQHCPAKHTPTVDVSKKWLDGEHAVDKVKIAALLQLIGRMKADVALYIHGYNTCAVECAHGERTVLTSKRIEYWTNWRKQLLYEANRKEVKGTDESGEADGTASAGPVATKKRGRRKKKVQTAEDGDKENADPRAGSSKSGKRQKTVVGLVEDCGRTVV